MKRRLFFSIIAVMALLMTACQPKEVVSEELVPDGAELNLEVTTLNGTVTSTMNIFSQAELTVVNVWEPSCVDCADDMELLAVLNQEYAGMGAQVIGLVKGVSGANDADALAVISDVGANYTQLLASEELTSEYLSDSPDVPTTLFIDKYGNVLGKSGGNNKTLQDWRVEIESYHHEVCIGDHPADSSGGG